jgi:hypothetical protein
LRTTTRELEIVNDLPPHPNLCVYHGCVLDGEYIRGMVYEKLHSTLDQQVSGQKRVDGKWIDLKPEERVRVVPEEVLRDVRAALQHIRTQLGLLYIDIHHNNIMWRSRPGTKRGGEWCIIDFSECYPDGHTFEHEFGNPGWISCKARVVDDALNETSLAHLDTYMRTGEAPYPDWEWAHWNQERSDEN